jgi:hypothetical protein
MNYAKPELQIVGSAKTLVRGAANGREYPDNPAGCSIGNLSRDNYQC